MPDRLSPIIFANLLVLGAALLLTLRLIYPAYRMSQDFLTTVLRVAGWSLGLMGLLGVMMHLGWLIGTALWLTLLISLLMIMDRYRRGEYRAFMACLGMAATRDIPLDEVAEAFSAASDNAVRRRIRLLCLRPGAVAGERIRRVDGRGVNLDADLARPCMRHGNVHDLEDLRPAVRHKSYCPHRFSSTELGVGV